MGSWNLYLDDVIQTFFVIVAKSLPTRSLYLMVVDVNTSYGA